jgi:hypothetical protein
MTYETPRVVLHYEACLCRGTGYLGPKKTHPCKSNRVLIVQRENWKFLGKPKTADAVREMSCASK